MTWWKRRPRSKRRRVAFVALALFIIVAAFFGRATVFLTLVALNDCDDRRPTPAGFVDDASRLNQSAIADVVKVPGDLTEAERMIRNALERARRDHLPVCIAGARHTMGGQSIAAGGIQIDMGSFNHFELDATGEVLHVHSGARWDSIIPYLDARGRSIEVMQSNNSFTVGGSLSANCHGWQSDRPPIASTIIDFRLMKADGEIVRCSRTENAEVFSLVIGGYGLFGVILDVHLRTVPNERYVLAYEVVDGDRIAQVFHDRVVGRTDIGMAYARLCVSPEDFLQQGVMNVFYRAPVSTGEIPALGPESLATIKRHVFRGSADSDYGKRLRWDAERLLSDHLAPKFVSRNQLLNVGVELFQNRSDAGTDILHEYFVPPENFAAFLDQMRTIMPRHSVDLLNVTVRHVLEDQDSFLRYADREMLSLVLLFNQRRSADSDAAMEAATHELIDAALQRGGRYYLPYRLHATTEQFATAYPQARAFFELKRRFDPDEAFQNAFYQRYGR